MTKSNLILGCVVSLWTIGGPFPLVPKLHADENVFVHNFDMNGDYTRHLHRADSMRVWNEAANGFDVRYWGPSESDKTGTVVYRYVLERPVESATVRANLLPHRDGDEVALDVSVDGENWNNVTRDRQHPLINPPHTLTKLDLTAWVLGSRQVYLRVRLKGRQLNSSIMSCQFLRTADRQPHFQAPSVYEFRAQLTPD